MIVGGGRSKTNEFAVGAAVESMRVGVGSMTATVALVRSRTPVPMSPVRPDIPIVSTNMEYLVKTSSPVMFTDSVENNTTVELKPAVFDPGGAVSTSERW